ncbi:MAG: hypothetical protein IPH16_02605 [Haliscomenobacter sp.]|nr:hypothetical protein [Haliscomenobacter sp.]MBK7475968.1 hypothetical protein [Haliscomenobacter sp.]MBK8877923.1 hypothetical protein [Haliscomenobacter sp.]
MKLEHSNQHLLPFHLFVDRMFRYGLLSTSLVAFSLALGMVGYHFFAGLSWLDSFYNACMILTGMGPVSVLTTSGAKLFSSFYALYSGIAFLSITAIIVAPLAHRVLHILHLEKDEE